MPNIHSTISFGLVNIPVLLNPLIKNNDLSFNQLHKKCLHRISYKKFCSHCKEMLKETDIIKGYQYEKDEYIDFTKAELDALKPENSGEIEILSFVPLKEIDPSYYEKNYILSTEKKSRAYSLFVKALNKSSLVPLCKTVLHNKFYYAIIRFYENIMILTTLYFQDEIKFIQPQENTKIDNKELDLATKLIESMKGHFEPEKYKDEYELKVKDAIKDKLNGKKIRKKKSVPKKEVSNLMKALEKSLKS